MTAEPSPALHHQQGTRYAASRPGHHRPADRLLRRHGSKDSARLGSYYADNITLTFANAPTITGRDAVLDQMTTLLGKVKSLAHPLINVWQEDGGVVILEVTSIWRLHDDTVIKINACSIFTLADGKFTDQRIYVDNAPINAFPQLTARSGARPGPAAAARLGVACATGCRFS
jgi:ketosteroid isomerase-like protein